MDRNQVLPLVFEVQKASYAAFTRKLHEEIGRSLSSSSQVRAAWLAVEDAGTESEKRYLQLALSGESANSDDAVAVVLRKLEREHRVRLTLSPCMSDIVPREIKEKLGLDQNWDNPHVSLSSKYWGLAR